MFRGLIPRVGSRSTAWGKSNCRGLSAASDALHLQPCSEAPLSSSWTPAVDSGGTLATLGLAMGAGATALALAAFSHPGRSGESGHKDNGTTVVHAADDLSHELYSEEQRTVALFERCSASVVHINTFVEKQGIVRGTMGYRLDLQEIPQGTGSGFVWDGQHIVTNYHVIKDAHRATVILSDHSSCEASLVGVEPDCDLAVLKVKPPSKSKGCIPIKGLQAPLQPLQVGRSDNLRVGQTAFAIGNPFGLDQTLTRGIVSGLGREMQGISGRTIRGLVQIDAAINPGNSGGPLLDARGRLIGVNTMIASPSGAFAGVGFAIPVDTVVRVVRQIVQYGHTKHAYLGVYLAPDHIARRLSHQLLQEGEAGLEGVLVLSIASNSPADDAGLKHTLRTSRGLVLGDEIVEVDGKKVSSSEALLDAVDAHSAGDMVEIVYKRHSDGSPGKLLRTTVRLGERPERFGNGNGSHGSGIPIAEPDYRNGERSRL